MPLSPEEAAALGLDAPAPKKALSTQEAAALGLDAKEPSFFKKAAKYVGETGADIATNVATLGGAVNPVLGAVGALGSYLQPGDRGSLSERYQREVRGLQGREQEAQTRSPVTTPAATMLGFMAAPIPGAAMSPASAATAGVTAKTLPSAFVKTTAAISDAALANAATKGLANADTLEGMARGAGEGADDPTKYAAAFLGPAMETLGPRMAARAQRAEDRASQLASRLFRSGPASTQIMEQRLGQGLHNPESAQNLAGEAIRSRPELTDPSLDSGSRAGAAGALLEKGSRAIAKVRALAEPRAIVEYEPYFAQLQAIRDELVGSAAARTDPDGIAAAKQIDEIITARKNEFAAKAREVAQRVEFTPGQGELGETATTATYPGRPGLRAGEPTEVIATSRELPGAEVVEPPPRKSSLPRSIELQSELRNEKGQVVRQGRFATNRQGTVAPPGYEQPVAGELSPSQPRSVAERGGTPETARLQGGMNETVNRTAQTPEGQARITMQQQLDPAFYGEQPPLFVDEATGRPQTPEEGGTRYQGTYRPNPDAPVHVNLKHAEAVPYEGTPETATQLNLFPDRPTPKVQVVPGEMETRVSGLPLSEMSKLKTWDQTTAHTTSSGTPRPEESIAQSLVLEFFKRAGAAGRVAEDKAIEGAFHPVAPGSKISRGVSGTSWQPERPLGRSINIGEPDKFSGIRAADKTPLARAREMAERVVEFRQGKADFGVAETILPPAKEIQRMSKEDLRELERSYSPRGAFWHKVFSMITPSDARMLRINEGVARKLRAGSQYEFKSLAEKQSALAVVERLRKEAEERE